MALIRGTFFFKDADASMGWSETHWTKSPDLSMAEALDLATTLGKLRAKMLARHCELHYLRVSDDLVRRDSLVAFVGPLGNGNMTDIKPVEGAEDLEAPERAYSTILLRCESGSLYRKQLYLSGVPDAAVVDPPGPNLSAEWKKTYNAWVAELKKSWGFKAQQREPANPIFQIADISLAAGVYTVTTTAAHGFAANQRVRISGVSSTPSKFFNKEWTIALTDPLVATKFTLRFATGTGAYITGGFVQAIKKVVVPYTGILVRGETHHSRGRPFGSPVGKRKRTKTA